MRFVNLMMSAKEEVLVAEGFTLIEDLVKRCRSFGITTFVLVRSNFFILGLCISPLRASPLKELVVRALQSYNGVLHDACLRALVSIANQRMCGC